MEEELWGAVENLWGDQVGDKKLPEKGYEGYQGLMARERFWGCYVYVWGNQAEAMRGTGS